MTRETYPSNRAVNYYFDKAGRIMGVNGSSSYAGGTCSRTSSQPDTCPSPIQYAAHGPILSLPLGNTLTETWAYNNRLQPTCMILGSNCTNPGSPVLALIFGYNSGTNNGNLANQTITRGTQSWKQNYLYDSLNRLGGVLPSAPASPQSFTESYNSGTAVPVQAFGYDGNANMYLASYNNSVVPAPTIETPQSANWFGSNNRITSFSYDNAGNVTQVGTNRSFSYDAENRQTSAVMGGNTITYGYDGEGRRVTKSLAGTATTTFVYDASGQMAAEYGGPTNTDTGTQYLSVDHLGSTRLVTDASGNPKYCYDYLPFGGDLVAGANSRPSCYPAATGSTFSDSDAVRFTGKERDAETGLDYFGARYMSSAQGRFTSPDPLLNSGRPWEPQSWNRYSYTLNNPLRYTDPTGLYEFGTCGEDVNCDASRQAFRNALAAAGQVAKTLKKGSAERKALDASLKAIGKENDGNHVTVDFANISAAGRTHATGSSVAANADTGRLETVTNVTITINSPIVSGVTGDGPGFYPNLEALIVHEGLHTSEAQAIGRDPYPGQETLDAEHRAYDAASFVFRSLHSEDRISRVPIWNPSWAAADREKNRQNAVDRNAQDSRGVR
jgi:RHS repeat-associated protein